MAEYTIELGALIESGFDIWDFTPKYPIFDEEYREPLQAYIENYYYDNEIGFETAELFRRNINRSLIAIMPYYNQLLKSATLELGADVLISRKETSRDTHTISKDGTENSESTQTHNNTSKRTDNLQTNTEKDLADTYSTENSKTSEQTRTDDLTETTTHNTQVSVDGTTTTTGTDTRTDNLTESANGTSSVDRTVSGSEDNKHADYDIPVSGSSNGFDAKYMSGGNVEDNSSNEHTDETNTSQNTKNNTGTQQTEKNDSTTKEEAQKTTGTDTVTNTGTQKDAGSETGTEDRTETHTGTETVSNTGTQDTSDNGESTGTGKVTRNEKTVDEYIHELESNDVPKFELLARLRQTFLNINQMICDDDAVWNCFMHIM